MPKPTTYATPICIALTIFALIGILLGLALGRVIIPMIALLPVAIYEVYRTEGASTKISSWLMLIVIVAEIVFLIFNINWNLANFLGTDTQYVAGYTISLGDVKVVAPLAMAVLSVILFIRTYGVYTKWLAAIIFVSAFVIIYILDPNIYKETIRTAVQEVLYRAF